MSAKPEDARPDMVSIEVDGVPLQAPKGSMLIEATDKADIYVPRFCYHRKLSVAANCRMCLVEVERAPKPLPACATPVADGMKVYTRSPKALSAQRGVMEFLLINHPLDCPICDQGGECELQDLAMGYGRGVSRFSERKRVVKDENLGPLVATDMTRCIHCTRCVRFLDEVAGSRELGGMFRGEHTEIGTLVGRGVQSELSGNVIDLCPVGALTNKPFRFNARSWEMLSHASVAPHDAVGSNISLHQLRGTVRRVVPRENEDVNEIWISDRDRYSYQGIRSSDRLERPMLRRDGDWREVEWEEALAAAAGALRDTAGEDLGVLVSPSATLEEMSLLEQLALGCDNIDHRLRQADFRDDASAPAYPSLGVALGDIPSLDAVLVVGGYPRHDQPLFNHRLRRAALAGASVWFLNPRRFDWNLPVAGELMAGPAAMAGELAAVVQALAGLGGAKAPAQVADVPGGSKPGEAHQALAKALHEAGRVAVFTGNLVETHPDGATLRALAGAVADLAGGSLGVLTQGANSAGGWLAGAVPVRRGDGASAAGLDARAMLEQPRRGYLTLGVEPEHDCWDGAAALQALTRAESVVCLTSYATDAMLEYASVLLPVGAFAETAGTFVNAEGRWQSFAGAARPPGDARPAWRVLRVLGNLLDLDGFDYQSAEDVREALRRRTGEPAGGAWPRDVHPTRLGGEGLLRAGATAMFGTDPLVRRAPALQETVHAGWAIARVAPATAKALGFEDGDRVRVQQTGDPVDLVLAVDDAVTEGTVWLPAGLRGAAALGPLLGRVTLSRS